jgi:hypothetical protein
MLKVAMLKVVGHTAILPKMRPYDGVNHNQYSNTRRKTRGPLTKCRERRQVARGRSGGTGAYMEYVRMPSTARVQDAERSNLIRGSLKGDSHV